MKNKELLLKRREEAKETQRQNRLHDPIEDDHRYIELLNAAEAEVELKLKGISRGRGFCHLYWKTKKEILSNNYGVIWFSPSEMNPGNKYD